MLLMRQLILPILFLFLLLGSTGCGTTNDNGNFAEGGNNEYIKKIQLGTGNKEGTYQPLGSEIANSLSKHIENDEIKIEMTSTNSSFDNLTKIGRGDLQIGMAIHIAVLEAEQGIGQFEGNPIENVAFMGYMYPEVMQILTNSKDVKSLADLEGKRIAVGAYGSATQVAAKKILETAGLKDGDYTAVGGELKDLNTKLLNGQVDALFTFLGLSDQSIDNLLEKNQDLAFLEIDNKTLAKLETTTEFESFVIPKDSYNWVSKDIQTIKASAILVGSTSQVSSDLGYKITKTLYEEAGKLKHEQAKHFKKADLLKGSYGLEIHPGSKKYFQEIGLLKK